MKHSIGGDVTATSTEHNRSDDTDTLRRLSGAAVRRPAITEALERSFFEEWAAVGYAALSLEKVARRAGVGKAALYRRWPSKLEMASELLSRGGLMVTESDDTGSLETDLRAHLLAIRRALRHRLVRRIVADLHAEIEREPALAAAVRPFQQARRRRAEALIVRAVDRGELRPDVDRATLLDVIAAPLYWRLVMTGGRSNRPHVELLARMMAAAARAA